MELEEKAEEILESLWIATEEKKEDYLALDTLKETEKEPIDSLLGSGHVVQTSGGIRLTDEGKEAARSVVRRHRLSERLLADVLGTGGKLMHEKACKFEHLLDRGLDENICSLLGHPKVCPHGKPIPPGRCCQMEQRRVEAVVAPLSQLAPQQRGKVAYIYAVEVSQLQKLMAMGILPGAPIHLIQNFPSYVFRVGQSQFAVDKGVADAIYVRLIARATHTDVPPGRPARKRGGQGSLARVFNRWWSERDKPRDR